MNATVLDVTNELLCGHYHTPHVRPRPTYRASKDTPAHSLTLFDLHRTN